MDCDLVILAGGIGSRLKNVNKSKTPKPLIKFNNFHFLDYILMKFSKFNFVIRANRFLIDLTMETTAEEFSHHP